MTPVRRTNGVGRAIPWIVGVGVLGLGALALRGSLRPDPERAGVVVDSFASLPRPNESPLELELTATADAPPRRVAGESLDTPGGDPSHGFSLVPADAYEALFEVVSQFTSVPLSELADAELLGNGPDERRIAYLRAVHRLDRKRADELFVRAIGELPVRSGPHGTSVPEYALSHLGERAAAEPGARAALRAVTFGPRRVASASLRRQAAIHLGRASSAAELQALAAELRAEPDGLVRAAFAAGLLSNSEERLVRVLFTDLLAERAALAGDGDLIHDLETP